MSRYGKKCEAHPTLGGRVPPRLRRRLFSRCLCHPGLPSTDAAGSVHYGRIHVDHLVHKTTCKRRAIASQLPNNVSRGQHVASDVHGDACPVSQGISNTCPACFGPIGTPLAYHVAYKSEHPCDAHSARPSRARTQPRYEPRLENMPGHPAPHGCSARGAPLWCSLHQARCINPCRH
ncbi:hypothetical protein GALL_222540 [mine drainage metagenome]|uniref:Uncharacterized protein n=1 Tax=mine drainage metagenome TaxID=410659 RepID=A0A1J5S200_9ZZZZ